MKSTLQLILWYVFSGCFFVPSNLAAQTKTADKPAQQLKVAHIFGNNMVLQRGRKIPVWGWGVPGQPVSIQVGNRTWRGKADKVSGKWRIDIDSLPTGNNYTLLIRQPRQADIRLDSVAVGEVWICSGQSNMEWQVRVGMDAEKEIASANYPLIRHFKIPHIAKFTLQDSLPASTWQSALPQHVGEFSAVAYAFARHLHDSLRVPVGIINATWGGTQIEAWMSKESLATLPDMAEHIARVPVEGNATTDSIINKNPNRYPFVLFNAMIHPLIPFAFRGVIWYQGETNAPRAVHYREVFPTLIRDWRKKWGIEFPFLFVQLANWKADGGTSQNGGSSWAELREAQAMTLAVPNTGMAVIIDIGESQDVHPRNKQDVGYRLALNALHIAYGRNIPYSSPFFAEKVLQNQTIMLSFKNTYGKLTVKNDRYGYVRGFEVAGADGQFFPAQARIVDNDRIIVSCEQVSRPEHVRYAWADDPADANVINAIGLPLAPFRTDKFPEKTLGKKFNVK